MKKAVLIAAASLAMVSNAQASGCYEGTVCGASGMSLLYTQYGTTAVTASPSFTTDALHNDVVHVAADAAIALETGVASPELLSVIEKIRAEVPEMANHSDQEIVALIVNK